MALVVILAAGKGTRMKSNLPKVMHKIAHLSMIGHVIRASQGHEIAVIISPEQKAQGLLEKEVFQHAPNAQIFIQHEQLGTGHALMQAMPAMNGQDVILLFGDVPLITTQSIAKLEAALQSANVAVLGFEAENPHGYGRMIVEGHQLTRIVEEADATLQEKAVRFCNGGPFAFKGGVVKDLLSRIQINEKKQEYYVTDSVALARKAGFNVSAVKVSETELMGVNDRVQLSNAEHIKQEFLRAHFMREGVTLHAPHTTFFAYDTHIENDVVIEPNVVFASGCTVKTGAVIHAFSHLEGAIVGENASIGPYARLRPGTNLGAKTKVGNFVEIKNAQIEEGAKVNHLSYIGDAFVGAGANIGAGTITCNYDGFNKFKTHIGAGAFVGSNSSLVAPVTIGEDSYVGSGSVITKDVAPNALAIARGKQSEYAGWATHFRAKAKNK